MSAASPRCAGVLFDLDGTLLDSAPDLAAALARYTRAQGVPMPAYARVRAAVSAGGSAILRTAWPDAPPARIAALLPGYLEIYAGMLAEHSRLFPGIEPLLRALETARRPWGIVTDKVTALTRPLLLRLPALQRAGVVVCGDTLPHRKPAPEPLLYACERLGAAPARSVYVGDDHRDIDAARAAGMRSIAVGWGYGGDGEDPAAWAADALVHDAAALTRALDLAHG